MTEPAITVRVGHRYAEEFVLHAIDVAQTIGVIAAAKELGCHRENIRRWMRERNIRPRYGRRPTEKSIRDRG